MQHLQLYSATSMANGSRALVPTACRCPFEVQCVVAHVVPAGTIMWALDQSLVSPWQGKTPGFAALTPVCTVAHLFLVTTRRR